MIHLTPTQKRKCCNTSPVPTDKAVTLQHFHHTFRERSLDLRTVFTASFFRSCLGCAIQFHPKDVVADKRTVHRLTTAVFCSFRNETNTYTGDLRCIHLICRVWHNTLHCSVYGKIIKNQIKKRLLSGSLFFNIYNSHFLGTLR